ncbi:hypothetical protein ACGIF2_10400 [Cellulomonas sp. P22]|uniref:hypothetical protein n=1 Tax=Cellulomonas sp. P22 TaxID=3373189 RepID=UPI00378EC768
MTRPGPEVEVQTGPAVPAVALRCALAVTAAAALALAWAPAPPAVLSPVTLVLALLVAALVWQPGLGLGAVLALVVGGRVVAGDLLGPVALGVLVLLVHLVLWLAALATPTSWRTRVEVAVVVAGLRDLVVVQLGVQVLAVVALALARDGLAAGDAWRLGALLLAGAVVVLVLPRPARLWWHDTE